VRPERARRVLARGHRGGYARRGAAVAGSPTAQLRRDLRQNDPRGSAYTPLHRNQRGEAGKRGLTGEAVGVASVDGVAEEKPANSSVEAPRMCSLAARGEGGHEAAIGLRHRR
jgi:hypothetical protein